jgi:hypothetical protein
MFRLYNIKFLSNLTNPFITKCEYDENVMKSKEFTTMTGKEFKKTFPNYKPVKLLHDDLIHNDFTYKLGINKDHIEFSPKKSCSEGGLYFCDETEIDEHINCSIYKISLVEILDDSEIYIENNKCKANKIYLKKICSITEHINKIDNNYTRYIIRDMYEQCEKCD